MQQGEVRPLDRTWWRKLNWVLDQLENDGLKTVRELAHQLNCAVLSYEIKEQKTFELHWEQAEKSRLDIFKLLFPYVKDVTGRADIIKQMTSQWSSVWGDPNSPDTQKKIDETIQSMWKSVKTEQRKRNAPATPRIRIRRGKDRG